MLTNLIGLIVSIIAFIGYLLLISEKEEWMTEYQTLIVWFIAMFVVYFSYSLVIGIWECLP